MSSEGGLRGVGKEEVGRGFGAAFEQEISLILKREEEGHEGFFPGALDPVGFFGEVTVRTEFGPEPGVALADTGEAAHLGDDETDALVADLFDLADEFAFFAHLPTEVPCLRLLLLPTGSVILYEEDEGLGELAPFAFSPGGGLQDGLDALEAHLPFGEDSFEFEGGKHEVSG
jgi:hypothetical protein